MRVRMPRAVARRRALAAVARRAARRQVLHEHGVGHRAHAAGHGGDGAGHRQDRGQVDVADDVPVREDVDAAVDDDRARLDGRAADEPGRPGGHDDDLGPPDLRIEVPRLAVADRHGGVLLDEQQLGRPTHDVAAADDDGRPAGQRDARTSQDLQGGLGAGRREAAGPARDEAGVDAGGCRRGPCAGSSASMMPPSSRPGGSGSWRMTPATASSSLRASSVPAHRRRDPRQRRADDVAPATRPSAAVAHDAPRVDGRGGIVPDEDARAPPGSSRAPS